MNFEQWKAAAAAKLEDEYGIDAGSIPEEVWRRFFVTNHAPRDAAERVAVLFTEGPLRWPANGQQSGKLR
jgi:hypothetical protein